MKTTRKFTALLAVLSLLLALWAPMAVVAAPAETAVAAPAVRAVADPLEAPLELLARLDNGDKLCAVYRLILDAVKTGTDYIHFDDYTLSEEEQQILQSVVDATLPENYGNNVGHSYCSVGETYFFNYFYTWDMTEEHKQQTNQQIDALTADLTGKSDFEKSVILYERLAQVNRYDYGTYHQTAYGALVEGMSVCAGYARAYQALLQAVGIPCLYVSGLADNGYEIGGHAWNVVQLDGKWYYADPTWDDHDSVDLPMDYSYFNITYDEISVDHFLDAVYELWVPTEPNTDANYYVHEGVVCETLTVEQMTELFRHQDTLVLYVTGDRNAVATLFFSYAYEIAAATGKENIRFVTYSTAGEHGLMLIYTFEEEHDHIYTAEVVAPTCYSDGYTFYFCTICGDCYIDNYLPAAHDYSNGWLATEDAHYHQCVACGTAADVAEHLWDGKACTVCGYEAAPTVIPGDANGDGKVNNRDLGVLQKHLNGSAVTIDLTAADLNGDGKINNRDLGMLQKLLNA